MPPQRDYITLQGFERLQVELKHLLRVERPKVVQEVADAAAQGDRSENAEYIYGKKRLREIDRRVRWLQKRLEVLTVVDPAQQSGDKVFFGATLVLEEDGRDQELTLKIVGSDETDTERGHISWRSPIGRALLGRKVDDEVKVTTPAGPRMFVILEVDYL
jgi:transcription elongation factor GreB